MRTTHTTLRDPAKGRPHLPLRFWGAFLLSVAFAHGIESYAEHLLQSGTMESTLGRSLFGIAGIYQQLVTAGPRTLASRYTALVDLNPPAGPASVSVYNLCDQRMFLAHLLRRIASANPSVIAIDKYFLTSTCEETDLRTELLKAAITDISRNVPVVLGRRVDAATRDGQDDRIVPTLVPSVTFPGEKWKGPPEALVNIDRDTRRLALRWFVREREAPEHSGDWMATLALEAAVLHDPELASRPRFASVLEQHAHPFISYIPEEEFRRLPALRVLCGRAASVGEAWRQCLSQPADSEYIQQLRNRIVILGETNADMDKHMTIMGAMPGIIIQANYVEALLDERYYEPVADWINYTIGLIVFGVFQLIVTLNHGSIVKMAIGILLLVCGTLSLLYLVATHLGWYLNPGTVSLLAIAISFGHVVVDRVRHTTERH